jgi:drug/metabolite transporter, DME family
VIAGVVMVTAAAMTWGTWSLFLRPTGLPATVASPIIFAIMAVVAMPLALRSRAAAMTWDRRTLLLLLGNAFFDGANVLTFFGALSYTTVAIAVLSHYVAPILIAVVAPKIDGVAVRGTGPAAAVALLGLVIVLEPWHAPAAGAAIGAALGVLSAVCYAGNVFVVRRLAERIGAPRAMAYHSVIAAALLAPFAIGGLGEVTGSDLGLLAAGAVTIGAASGIMFSLGLLRIGAARAAVLTFAEPLVAVAVGALVWEEALHPLAAVGGALVLGAGIHVARKAR